MSADTAKGILVNNLSLCVYITHLTHTAHTKVSPLSPDKQLCSQQFCQTFRDVVLASEGQNLQFTERLGEALLK